MKKIVVPKARSKSLVFKDFDCPICGSKEIQVKSPSTLGNSLPNFGYNFSPSHTRMYRIVQCRKCTHAYSSPRPQSLYENYEDVVDTEYLKNQEQRLITAQKVLSRIMKLIAPSKSTRLLDIGCATGDFLEAAKQYYDVSGLELSHWASRIAEERGFRIQKKPIHRLRGVHAQIITLWGVIEHFEYPDREISNISRLLTKGGFVCLWTGNYDSLMAKFLGKKWWYMQGQHIQLFTQKSLDLLFLQNNFERVYLKRYPYVMSFQSIAKSLERYPGISWLSNFVLNLKWLRNIKLTLSMPGEMFAIYRKKELE